MSPDQSAEDSVFVNRTVEAAIRVGLVFLMALWCFQIFRPFIGPVVWGMIIAVAVHPLYLKLVRIMGNRPGRAAVVFTLLALALLITPTVMLSTSIVESAAKLAASLEDGSLHIPPPGPSVKEWPVIGEPLHAFWSLASQNVVAAAQKIGPQLKAAGGWALSAVAGAGLGVLSFVIAIIIAGMLLANADKCTSMAERLAVRMAGEQGADFASIAGATVRSVAQGVLGVAFIQGVLAGIGLLVMGVPAAGLWALLVMLLAIVQLPALLVLGPIIVYVFSAASTVPAVIFMIYMILVSLSDSVLKPLLLGRGVELPMLVILIGAIGGMMLSGIVGLFVGAVILALGYKLFVAWLDRDATAGEPETAAAEAGSG